MQHFTNPFSVRQRLFFSFYVRFERLLYVDYMENAKLLADWLVTGDTDAYQYCDHVALNGPDVCAHCFSYHGITLAGRLRAGCILCTNRNQRGHLAGYTVGNLTKLLNLSAEQVELGLAQAALEVVEWEGQQCR